MLAQTYSATEIKNLISKIDVMKWHLWKSKAECDITCEEIAQKIKLKKYTVSDLCAIKIKNKNAVKITDQNPEDLLAVRCLDRYLRKIYKTIQPRRSDMINRIIPYLKEGSSKDGCGLSIIRTDIKDFYETVDFKDLIQKISDDSLIDYKGISLLNSIFIKSRKIGICGIPRGLCISPTLAEIYMREIDREIKGTKDVFAYMRYVDDIVAIVRTSEKEIAFSAISSAITNKKLALNHEKTATADFPNISNLDYLGYSFTQELVETKKGKNKNEKEICLHIGISERKIRKRMTQISKSFAAFRKSKDFDILIDRLRYLSAAHPIKKDKGKWLVSGNAYSYPNLTDGQQKSLKKIDFFLSKTINGEVRSGKGLVFDDLQLKALKKISFFKSYEKNLINLFSRARRRKIKKGINV